MKNIETLETYRLKSLLRTPYTFLCVEKVLAEKFFKWIKLKIVKLEGNYYIFGKGSLQPTGCKQSYQVQVIFSPFFGGNRFPQLYSKFGSFWHHCLNFRSKLSTFRS